MTTAPNGNFIVERGGRRGDRQRARWRVCERDSARESGLLPLTHVMAW